MLNGSQKKSHVTKQYAGKEQNEKCAKSLKIRTRKRDQRKRDKLLGVNARKLFAEQASRNNAELFIHWVLSKHPIGLDWKEKPHRFAGGFVSEDEDLRDLEIYEAPNGALPVVSLGRIRDLLKD